MLLSKVAILGVDALATLIPFKRAFDSSRRIPKQRTFVAQFRQLIVGVFRANLIRRNAGALCVDSLQDEEVDDRPDDAEES